MRFCGETCRSCQPPSLLGAYRHTVAKDQPRSPEAWSSAGTGPDGATSVDRAVDCTNERHCEEGWLFAGVRPAVPCSVLNVGVTWIQFHFLPVVQFEDRSSREHDAVVNGGRGVHSWIV